MINVIIVEDDAASSRRLEQFVRAGRTSSLWISKCRTWTG